MWNTLLSRKCQLENDAEDIHQLDGQTPDKVCRHVHNKLRFATSGIRPSPTLSQHWIITRDLRSHSNRHTSISDVRTMIIISNITTVYENKAFNFNTLAYTQQGKHLWPICYIVWIYDIVNFANVKLNIATFTQLCCSPSCVLTRI